MQALTFWKTVVMDETNLLERLLELLAGHAIHYCVIGSQAVNAYVEPLVSLDLDLVIAVDQMAFARSLLEASFTVREFAHSLNVSLPGSDLRVQIHTDPAYNDFVDSATAQPVLGITLPVASVENVLRGKVWAAQDPQRRPTKRQKDLADIARLLERYPHLRADVPAEILGRLL